MLAFLYMRAIHPQIVPLCRSLFLHVCMWNHSCLSNTESPIVDVIYMTVSALHDTVSLKPAAVRCVLHASSCSRARTRCYNRTRGPPRFRALLRADGSVLNRTRLEAVPLCPMRNAASPHSPRSAAAACVCRQSQNDLCSGPLCAPCDRATGAAQRPALCAGRDAGQSVELCALAIFTPNLA